MPNKNPYTRILSIDGGGIRGLIPAMILQKLEEETKKSIGQLFDLIVGTSTGGILATGLARPDTPCTAEELAEVYSGRGKEIFNRSFWKGMTSVGGIFDERYDAGPLEGILEEILGDAELKYTEPDIVVTSYDIEQRKPYYFKTSKARKEPGRNHLLRQVARATSAAPTYFEPLLLSKQERRALIDGGVFANNPAMVALSEALSSGASVDQIVLCSVGTGTNIRKIFYDDAKDWGILEWARPILSVMMDGMSDSADYHARQLLPDEEHGADQRYFRFNISLKHASDDLDAANQGNIDALQREAEEIMKQQGTELDRLIALLKSNPAGATP